MTVKYSYLIKSLHNLCQLPNNLILKDKLFENQEHSLYRKPRQDFSFFQQQIPGLYFFLGGLPEGGTPAGHHTPDFYIDESGLELGVRSLSHIVVDYFDSVGN